MNRHGNPSSGGCITKRAAFRRQAQPAIAEGGGLGAPSAHTLGPSPLPRAFGRPAPRRPDGFAGGGGAADREGAVASAPCRRTHRSELHRGGLRRIREAGHRRVRSRRPSPIDRRCGEAAGRARRSSPVGRRCKRPSGFERGKRVRSGRDRRCCGCGRAAARGERRASSKERRPRDRGTARLGRRGRSDDRHDGARRRAGQQRRHRRATPPHPLRRQPCQQPRRACHGGERQRRRFERVFVLDGDVCTQGRRGAGAGHAAAGAAWRWRGWRLIDLHHLRSPHRRLLLSQTFGRLSLGHDRRGARCLRAAGGGCKRRRWRRRR